MLLLLRCTLQEAYECVCKDLSRHLRCQKEIYAHAKSYEKGDLAWLYNAVVTKGKSKKYHKPWQPFQGGKENIRGNLPNTAIE